MSGTINGLFGRIDTVRLSKPNLERKTEDSLFYIIFITFELKES